MSSFDVKTISEQDAFRLDNARREEARMEHTGTGEPGEAIPQDQSPVAEVVEQIMSHWAEADEGFVQELADSTGDAGLKKIIGEKAADDALHPEGMSGDFKADAAGPDEKIDVPPRAGGTQMGGGGGGGGGEGGDAGLPDWMGDEGGMADPGDAPPDLPGFSLEGDDRTYGGDGEGDDDDEPAPPKPPEDPKKPKQP